jgi:hypothetical protein
LKNSAPISDADRLLISFVDFRERCTRYLRNDQTFQLIVFYASREKNTDRDEHLICRGAILSCVTTLLNSAKSPQGEIQSEDNPYSSAVLSGLYLAAADHGHIDSKLEQSITQYSLEQAHITLYQQLDRMSRVAMDSDKVGRTL